jgi:hypothetical protein
MSDRRLASETPRVVRFSQTGVDVSGGAGD